jgi:hypothetical protein
MSEPIVPAVHDAEALIARAAELERRLVELEAMTRTRVIAAELKAEAVRAGMVDLDGLKLVDAGGLAVDEAGAVQGAAALMAQLRRSKPWLFGAANSSSAAAAPPANPPRAKLATEMSMTEWRAARGELLRRR